MKMGAWERILNANKLPSISEFSTKIDLNESMTITRTGKPGLDQIIEILNLVNGLDEQTALVLPEGFLYRIDARTVRKNLRPLKLRRINTKHEAIEQKITPQKLINEKIEQMRRAYELNPESLCEDYAGINYRGITRRENKNYLFSDNVEGFLHSKIASTLIQVRRYDTLESLLRSKDSRRLSKEDRLSIRRELLKVRKRKMLTSEKARRIILTGNAERVVRVPSRSEYNKFYEIKFRRLPVSFSLNDKEFYATWTDLWTEPSCNCDEKKWYIKYVIDPKEIIHCVHEIAAFRKTLNDDWGRGTPITHPSPFIATSPFFKPTQDYIDYYMRWKNQVFAKKGNSYEHLSKVYIDIWTEKQVRRGKIELL